MGPGQGQRTSCGETQGPGSHGGIAEEGGDKGAENRGEGFPGVLGRVVENITDQKNIFKKIKLAGSAGE